MTSPGVKPPLLLLWFPPLSAPGSVSGFQPAWHMKTEWPLMVLAVCYMTEFSTQHDMLCVFYIYVLYCMYSRVYGSRDLLNWISHYHRGLQIWWQQPGDEPPYSMIDSWSALSCEAHTLSGRCPEANSSLGKLRYQLIGWLVKAEVWRSHLVQVYEHVWDQDTKLSSPVCWIHLFASLLLVWILI